MLRTLIDPLASLLYPQHCHVCGGDAGSIENGVACDDCWKATRIFDGTEPLCAKCGAMLRDLSLRCPHCIDAEFDRAVSAGVYECALAVTVVHLKKVPHLSARASRLFARRMSISDLGENAVVIPIPLSKRRLYERGFDQTGVLSKIVAKATGFPIVNGGLQRTSHTPMHRIAMDKKAREKTVQNAFEVFSPKLIDGRQVILVDDVMTSGSTASACARVLKKHGAVRVTVATLARAVM